jgi:hypothetical protein
MIHSEPPSCHFSPPIKVLEIFYQSGLREGKMRRENSERKKKGKFQIKNP